MRMISRVSIRGMWDYPTYQVKVLWEESAPLNLVQPKIRYDT